MLIVADNAPSRVVYDLAIVETEGAFSLYVSRMSRMTDSNDSCYAE